MFAMWPLWRPAGAGFAIPARPAALAGRERAGEGGGGSRVRFGALDGVEELPAGVLRGTAGRCPPGARLRRASGRGRKGAARRGFSRAGGARLSGAGTVETPVDAVQRRRCHCDADGELTGGTAVAALYLEQAGKGGSRLAVRCPWAS
jgi:hypothetical protein